MVHRVMLSMHQQIRSQHVTIVVIDFFVSRLEMLQILELYAVGMERVLRVQMFQMLQLYVVGIGPSNA